MVEAEFELKPSSRAESSPSPGASGPEVPSSLCPGSSIPEAGAATPPPPPNHSSPFRERSWARRPLLAPSPRSVSRYQGGHRRRSPGSGLLPSSQTPPPSPARDSCCTRPLPSKAPPSLSPSKARSWPQAALGPGDRPHYPASRVNSNNSAHFTSAHCVPGV